MSNNSPQKPTEQPEPVTAAPETAPVDAKPAAAPERSADAVRDVAATESDGGAPAAASVDLPSATLQAELDAAQDRCLRLQAELENVRKRLHRAAEEERRYASLPLLRDLLPVVDNLQRAIQAAEQHENATALLDGVRLVASQLDGVLLRHHCAPILAHGEAFDPHLHEAIAQHPSDDHAPGHVCLVAQTGYQLHERVIRPAQVIVAAPRADAAEATEAPGDAGS